MQQKCLLAVLLLTFASTHPSLAQQNDHWLLRIEAGAYQIHESDENAGILFSLGRRFGSGQKAAAGVVVGSSVILGFGEDNFAALEINFELHLRLYRRLSLYGGTGAGLMAEQVFSTLSLPYCATIGLEVGVSPANSIRVTIRRGAHLNAGDSGTFSGPHLYTAGWVHSF